MKPPYVYFLSIIPHLFIEILQNIESELFMLFVGRKQTFGVVVTLVYGRSSRAAEIMQYPGRHAFDIGDFSDIFLI